MVYCIFIKLLFLRGFYFHEFCKSEPHKNFHFNIVLNENISKIAKLSPREFPHLVQNRENNCMRKYWCIHVHYSIFQHSFPLQSTLPAMLQRLDSRGILEKVLNCRCLYDFIIGPILLPSQVLFFMLGNK